MTEKKKHFKPLKWEDYEDDSAMATAKLPFQLNYVIFRYENDPNQNKVYSRTEVDFVYIPFFAKGNTFPTIPEAKKFAEQHYQGVMQKLDKAIEKLKLKNK